MILRILGIISMIFSLGRVEVLFKYSIWKWKITDHFNLNMSFTFFHLQYSGEACLQERIVINSTRYGNIGRFCGIRYYWSVFASSMPITMEFYTHELSWSKFILNYQVTDTILSTILLRYKSENTFDNIEYVGYIYPSSWIHKYSIANTSYYVWNILVSKMFNLFIKVLKAPAIIKSLVFFDGPDFHSAYYTVDTKTTFAASTFQMSILYLNKSDNINILFEKYAVMNMSGCYAVYNISTKIFLNSVDIFGTVFCTLKFIVPKGAFVNITLLSVKYSGPNVGYCKYGGLSLYDYVNNIFKEVFLSCHDRFISPFKSLHTRMIISSTETLFLIFYAYQPYSIIKVSVKVESTICQGVHVLRYFFSIMFYSLIHVIKVYSVSKIFKASLDETFDILSDITGNT